MSQKTWLILDILWGYKDIIKPLLKDSQVYPTPLLLYRKGEGLFDGQLSAKIVLSN